MKKLAIIGVAAVVLPAIIGASAARSQDEPTSTFTGSASLTMQQVKGKYRDPFTGKVYRNRKTITVRTVMADKCLFRLALRYSMPDRTHFLWVRMALDNYSDNYSGISHPFELEGNAERWVLGWPLDLSRFDYWDVVHVSQLSLGTHTAFVRFYPDALSWSGRVRVRFEVLAARSDYDANGNYRGLSTTKVGALTVNVVRLPQERGYRDCYAFR